jgi:hypothetical protein
MRYADRLPGTDVAQQLELDFDEPPFLRPTNPLDRPVRRASSLRVPVRGIVGSNRARVDRVSSTGVERHEAGPSGPDDPCFDAWLHAVYDRAADGVDDPLEASGSESG